MTVLWLSGSLQWVQGQSSCSACNVPNASREFYQFRNSVKHKKNMADKIVDSWDEFNVTLRPYFQA